MNKNGRKFITKAEVMGYAVLKKRVYKNMYSQENNYFIECNANQSFGEYIKRK